MSMAGERRIVAVVNYKKIPVEIDLRPLGLEAATTYALTDLKTGEVIRSGAGRDLTYVNISVPAVDYVCVVMAPAK
jgi:hypothetical protein